MSHAPGETESVLSDAMKAEIARQVREGIAEELESIRKALTTEATRAVAPRPESTRLAAETSEVGPVLDAPVPLISVPSPLRVRWRATHPGSHRLVEEDFESAVGSPELMEPDLLRPAVAQGRRPERKEAAKLAKPRKFAGTVEANEYRLWERGLRKFLEGSDIWYPRMSRAITLSYLAGDALLWVDFAEKNSGRMFNVDEILACLNDRYNIRKPNYVYLRQLFDTKQKRGEKTRRFVERFLATAREVEGITDDTMVSAFMSGLHVNIAEDIIISHQGDISGKSFASISRFAVQLSSVIDEGKYTGI